MRFGRRIIGNLILPNDSACANKERLIEMHKKNGVCSIIIPETRPLRVIFYIDALNLYSGALNGTAYRWLDLSKFCSAAFRQKPHFNEHSPLRKELPFLFQNGASTFSIEAIKYFTAKVKDLMWKEGSQHRQQLYWNAIQFGVSKITCYFGIFVNRVIPARDANHPSQIHEIIRLEEKRSDVNLAIQMAKDAILDKCDCVILVSNDTDFVPAMNMAREYGKIVGAVIPIRKGRWPAKAILDCSDFYFISNPSWLAECQMPDEVGGIKKPEKWR